MPPPAPQSARRGDLRAIPHNMEAEAALLGALLLRPESMHEVSSAVHPESFYAEKHRDIFAALLDVFTKGNPIDLLSVANRLKEKKTLERVGGASYLTELIEQVPAAGNAGYYAELVEQKAALRGLIRAADEIAELGFSNPEDIDEALDTAEKKIYQVTQSPSAQKFIPLRHSLGEAFERLNRLHNAQDELRGVRTGFPALDNLLAGLQKSDLVILAARPSVGKTSLALDIARNTACLFGTPVGIFSLEMSSQQLVDRMLAAEAKVDAWRLRTGKLATDEEFSLVQEAMGRLSEAPIHIDDQPGNTVLKMRSAARRLKNEHGLGLIVVDYLQLMMPAGPHRYDSMVQQVTEISRSLKIMARELDVPVLALSQLSRAVEQRRGRPRLSDLRDSGALEQDADVVLFIHRDDKMNENSQRPNIAEILVEKHRNGPTGAIELYFDEKRATFLSIETKRPNEEDLAAAPTDDDF